jgi:hypothetical protein
VRGELEGGRPAQPPGEVIRFAGKPTPATSLAIRVQVGKQFFIISIRRIDTSLPRATLKIALAQRKPALGKSTGLKVFGVKITRLVGKS